MAFTSNWVTDEVSRQTGISVANLTVEDFLKIKVISLPSSSLSGKIPEDFKYLTELVELDLSNNRLNTNPEILENCTKLQKLNLSTNYFGYKPIPRLTNLTHINIKSGGFASEIPPCIFSEKLEEANLGSNRFVGKLPSTVNLLKDGVTLNISYNRMIGTVSSELYNRLNMSIKKNQFIGTAPGSGEDMELNLFNSGTNQRRLYLKKNTQLTYELGDTIDLNLQSYIGLQLESGTNDSEVMTSQEYELYTDTDMIVCNVCVKSGIDTLEYRIKGTDASRLRFPIVTKVNGDGEIIPPITPPPIAPPDVFPLEQNPVANKISQIVGKPLDQINSTDCDKITGTFDLSNQNISGSLPREIGLLTKITALKFHKNPNLTSIPSEIKNCRSLKVLYAYDTKLNSIPSEIGELSELEEISLTDCQIASVPQSVENLVNLKSIDLSKNKIASLPNIFDKLENLTYLNVDKNNLSSLPSTIFENKTIERLFISNNSLRFIPSIENMTNLISLYAMDNNIEIDLNSEFLKNNNLVNVMLQNNKIGGALPSEISINLKELYLNDNKIGGDIPQSLQEIYSHIDLSNNQLIGDVDNPNGIRYDYNLLNDQINVSPLQLVSNASITLEIGEKLDLDDVRNLITMNGNTLSEANELIITNLDNEYFDNNLKALKEGNLVLNFKLKLSTRENDDNIDIPITIVGGEEEIPPIEPNIPSTEEFKKKSKRENKRVRVVKFD